ncbi:hypothetical protein C2E23DRAFT_802066, partial [Lenzites betulinus]
MATSHDPSQSNPAPRIIRTGEHREAAIKALKTWRLETILTRYQNTPFSESGLLSDDMIHALVYDASISSTSDIISKLRDPPWVFAPRAL